jgi:hypothetical protein
MAEQFANHPGTTLAGSGITSATRPVTFTLASSVGLPTSPNFRLLIEEEILLVSAVNGSNSFTASTVEGTTAATHASGVLVTHILTAGALVQLEADVTAGAASTGLQAANNLSDVASAVTSRANLGLGSAAVATASALTEATSSVLTITGGSTAVLNATSIQVKQASGSQGGYLASADWNTFNGKQSALGFVPLNPANNLSDVATASIARTNLGLTAAAIATPSALTEATSAVLTITGGSAALLAATTIQVKQASGSQSGYLSSTDWNTFNGKQAALTLPLSIANGGTGATSFLAAGLPTLSANNTFTGTQLILGTLTSAGAQFTLASTASGSLANHYLLNAAVTLAASAAVTNAYGVLFNSPTLGAGSSISTAYALYLAAQKVTGVGAAYGVYQAGASDLNLFAGATTFSAAVTFSVAPVFSDQPGTRTALGLTAAATATPAALTEATSSVLTITGGSAALLAATTIQVKQATTSVSGYLSSTDWNTFNNKQPALTVTNDTNVTGSVAGAALTLGWTGTLAAGRLNPNVVQSITNDTNVTGSIAAQVLTLAWSGQLSLARGGTGQSSAAAAYNALSPMTTLGDIEYESAANTASRLAGNITSTKKFLTQTGTGSVSAAPAWGTIATGDLPASVVDAVTNDTNVTGSITSNTLTLGWTGTLAAARLNANVVQSITNDTNITGSISAQVLTLGFTGTLSIARGGTGASTAATALSNLGGQPLSSINKNLIPDSDFKLGTAYWTTPGAGMAFTIGVGGDGGNAVVYTGTGSASAFSNSISVAIPVTPGVTYTFSAYIDATNCSGGSQPTWVLFNTSITTSYLSIGITNGTKGRVSNSFTVPVGVTRIVALCDTNTVTVTSGQPLVFSNPQLEIGSVATSYKPNLIDDLTGTLSLGSGGMKLQAGFANASGAAAAQFSPAWTGAGNFFNIYGGPTINGTATPVFTNFFSQMTFVASSATTNAFNFRAETPVYNTSSAVSNIYGLYINTLTSAGHTTNAYGIYQVGTSDLNVFNGPTTIAGTATFSAAANFFSATGAGIYLGNSAAAGTPDILFRSGGLGADHDSIISATGGTSANNHGTININAATVSLNCSTVALASGTVTILNNISSYLGNTTVQGGVPSELASVSLTAQNANIAATTFYTTTASPGFLYRISAYIVLTTADAASSTLPQVQVTYTDPNTSAATTIYVTPAASATAVPGASTGATNTTTMARSGVVVINASASTAIKYATTGYASGTSGAMKYALNILLEAL